MRILTFCATYLPAQRGGTVQAVAGLVGRLGGEVDFYVFTADRYPGDPQPHADIQPGVWQRRGDASVYYAPPRDLAPHRVARAVTSVQPDAYYVNSLLSPVFATVPVFLRWLGRIPDRPMVLAPRGELHPAALALKRGKKRAFLELVRRLPAYADLLWQAGSEDEADQIRRVFPRAQVAVARDLSVFRDAPDLPRQKKEPGELAVAYLSRITPMKNLAGALAMLGHLKGDIQLDVYGPCAEGDYLRKCQNVMRQLPGHVRVRFMGEIPHDRVLEALSAHHVFLLPTLGESFGHAILEALLAGCIPIIGNQTPWRDLQRAGAGWDLPPGDEQAFVRALQACVDMEDEEHAQRWAAARALGASAARSRDAVEENRALFERLRLT
jgi:glycosyltransferase involved in cell wall biosynthesis